MVDDLVRRVKPEQRDSVAAILRAKVRHALVGTHGEAPTVGRFRLLERVGAGSTGTVYAAYDPLLDRRVALKVLAKQDDPQSLLREARTLAKLRHPNVVTVHEAGRLGDEVYIAMEFIEGKNLRQWLDEGGAAASSIEAVLIAAGRGLAAAHAVGVAHGDFKPHNVLVGSDEVRVADFGLARFMDRDTSESGVHGGTPAYMSPERLDGGPPTIEADQFAYAVTLFEAAVGHRPFEGNTLDQLRLAQREPLTIPRASSPRSRWLAVARRGLALEPGQRFSSIDEMLAELQPPEPSRVLTTGRLLAVATGVAVVSALYAQREVAPCQGGEAELGKVWNATRGEALREVVLRANPTIGEPLAAQIVEQLDHYGASWVQAHHRICEATRVHATQSDSLYDLRMQCLARRRDELAALLAVIADVQRPHEASEALEAVGQLEPPHSCGTAAATEGSYALPEARATRARVQETRAEISRGWAHFRMARYEAAGAIAQSVVAAAEEIGFERLLGEALYFAAVVHGRTGQREDAETLLRRAHMVAARTADDTLAAEVSLQLLRSAMFGNDVERVEHIAELVRADVVRGEMDPNEVDGIVGEAWLHAGDPDRASAAIETALSTETRPPHVALLQSLLGSARLASGQADEAVRWYRRALDTATAHFGTLHPRIGFHQQRLGRGQLAAGDIEGSHRTLSEALSARQRALGPDDRAVASALVDLTKAELALGHDNQAREHLQRALEIRTASLGPDDPSLAELHLMLGDLDAAKSSWRAALQHYRRARTLRESTDLMHPELLQAQQSETTALHHLAP